MFIKSLVTRLGGSGAVARALSLPERSGPATVRGWVMRNNIPTDRINGVAALARVAGLGDISVGTLLAHAERRRTVVQEAAGAETR